MSVFLPRPIGHASIERHSQHGDVECNRVVRKAAVVRKVSEGDESTERLIDLLSILRSPIVDDGVARDLTEGNKAMRPGIGKAEQH